MSSAILDARESAELRARYRETGFAFQPAFVSRDECEEIVAVVEKHREKMINVEIDTLIAKFRFFTVNSEELEELVPAVQRLERELCAVASQLEGRPLVPLDNKRIGLSLNLMPASGKLSWHYDRNLVTAVVYLNEVEGGEFEVYPRYRVRLPNNHRGPRKLVQRVFDAAMRPRAVRNILGRKLTVPPTVGGIAFMDSTCLHQVAPVRGTVSRASIIFCYDEQGKVFSKDRTQNYYGYRDQPVRPYR